MTKKVKRYGEEFKAEAVKSIENCKLKNDNNIQLN